MKAILYIGSVLALLAGLVGLIMTFEGTTVETAQGLSILGSDFVAILLLALIQGVMDIRDLLKKQTGPPALQVHRPIEARIETKAPAAGKQNDSQTLISLDLRGKGPR